MQVGVTIKVQRWLNNISASTNPKQEEEKITLC